MDFCHLHVHSDFSLLDGAAKVRDLVAAAGDRGMSSLALTDHGNMCGAIEFYKAAKAAGIRPLLGVETYMAPGPRTERRRDPTTGVASFHLTLLAKNLTGYRNLVQLVSSSYTEGFYYNPRIDKQLLAEKHEGIVALSGCFKGETSYLLRTDRRDKAYEAAAWYRNVFDEDYFVEIQRNGTEGQEENNQELVRLAKDLSLPLVCTNDVHYLGAEDALAQEVRMAISTGKTLEDEGRLKHRSDDFWLKTPGEMSELFADFPQAVDATRDIASRCDVELPFGEFHLPQFEPPDGKTPDEYFAELCDAGLHERYGDPPPAAARERLAHEMGVIQKTGFVSYFLITWDFVRYAREQRIPVGPGRGSAAGSIVSYVLRITDVCPLEHELLFERFLNSARVSMPDIDIDFCRDGRQQVIEYVTEKYGGSECVSQIITFGTLAARAVVRDVGRALNVPLSEIDSLAKRIPNGPGATLSGAIESDPELAELSKDPRYAQLFEVSSRLEGMRRHASTHAAGVVVSDGPLKQYVPLYKIGDDVVTQFSMEHLEDIGLLKVDFLGLKTLTVIRRAVEIIERSTGDRIDLDALCASRGIDPGEARGFDDPKTWQMLQRGEALGVFQLESSGMRDLLRRLKPDRLDDLSAVVALYRPGPLESGMTDQFVRRKHGEEEIAYLHPSLEPALRESYGTVVYQEQVMLIVRHFAGFSLNDADGLRKAMGKKKLAVMLKFKTQFVEGALAHGAEQALAERIWDVMEQFAKYAFNKSHTVAYAVLSYQTAYLKANYPVQFIAALMTCDMGNTDKVVGYIDECRRLDIPVLPPDVNRSDAVFSVEFPDAAPTETQPAETAAETGDAERPREAIRFGLAAVKGLGMGAAEAIVATRDEQDEPFASLADLCESVDVQALGKTGLEAMVRAGALDSLTGHRAQQFAMIEQSLRAAAAVQEDRRAGQMSLFGGGGSPSDAAPPPEAELPAVEPWGEKDVLVHEKEALGFYMSSHPLAKHESLLRALSTHGTKDLAAAGEGARVLMGGMLTHVRTMYPKSGRNRARKMARVRVEDFDGSVGSVLFADAFERDGEHVTDEAIGFVEATVDLSREEPDLKVDRFVPVDEALGRYADALVVTAIPDHPEGPDSPEGPDDPHSPDDDPHGPHDPHGDGPSWGVLRALPDLLARHPGKCSVLVQARPVNGYRALYRLESRIAATRAAHDDAVSLLGAAAIRWRPRVSAPTRRR